MNRKFILRSDKTRTRVQENLFKTIRELEDGKIWDVVITPHKESRTSLQNNSMHLYFNQLADELNGSGLDMVTVLPVGFKISWTEYSIKKDLWGRIMKAMTGKTKTSQLETKEVSQIYEEINKNLSENWGLHVPFPDRHFRGYK